MIKPVIKFFDVRRNTDFDVKWWNDCGLIGNWPVVFDLRTLQVLDFGKWLDMALTND